MYSLSDIAKAIDGDLHGDGSLSIRDLYYDSRKLQNPQQGLFFAISTWRSDGHNYLAEVAKAGIAAVVVSKIPEINNLNHILVKDTTEALQKLARHHREKYPLKIIGITGSNGKTIVKEWISTLCANKFKVVKSPKSFNSQIGVPLSLWQIAPEDEIGVFEAGISQAGEMEKLETMIQPAIGVLTHLGPAHEKNFKSEEQKLAEKLQLFSGVKVLIAPGDRPLIRNEINKRNIPALFWGRDPENNLRILDATRGQQSTQLKLQLNKEEPFTINIPFTDQASVNNAISTIATALVLDFSVHEIRDAVALLQSIDMRLQQVPGINGNTLILDHYNSDLESLRHALEFMDQQDEVKQRTLIFSDIPESPVPGEELSKQVAQMCRNHNISRFIGIGEQFAPHQSHFEGMDTYFSPDTESFIKQYPLYTLNNQSILIKGGRAFQFEDIADVLSAKVHQTVLEVNMSSLQKNLRVHEALLPKGHKLMVMVKAFAYGVGGAQVAKLLEYNKVDYLGVAYLDEGIELRESGVHLPVLIMNPDMSKAALMAEFGLEPTIFSFGQLALLLKHLAGQSIKIHIEFNTGMNRLGFEPEESQELIRQLRLNQNLRIASVFSHFAVADDAGKDDFSLKQIGKFNQIAERMKAEFGDLLFHISNSPGIQRFEHREALLKHSNMARLGIGLYGVSSDPFLAPKLKTVATFKSYIAQIRNVAKGEGIGYGNHDKADYDRKVAVVAVGYADGYSRAFSRGVGSFLIHGKSAKVLGNVCMDMCMCDVTDIECSEGDEVIIFGDNPTITALADSIQTIPYEILSSVSQRVSRVFYQEQ